MCIAVFMWKSHPLYPFLLLINRDEYLSRPTKPLEWWEDREVLGGRDEVAGGTWLASSRSGRLAFLTNVRETRSIPDAKSRGDLPVRFLKSEKGPLEFAEEVLKDAEHYNGFNLILADFCSDKLVYLTNRAKGDNPSILQIPPGVHVLTNDSLLDSPWPKSRRLSRKFKELLDKQGEGSEINVTEMIEKVMRDKVKADECQLPGIHPQDFELQLSSIFIDTDTHLGRTYGTRSTSAVTVKNNGLVRFYERYLDNDCWNERVKAYEIGAKE